MRYQRKDEAFFRQEGMILTDYEPPPPRNWRAEIEAWLDKPVRADIGELLDSLSARHQETPDEKPLRPRK